MRSLWQGKFNFRRLRGRVAMAVAAPARRGLPAAVLGLVLLAAGPAAAAELVMFTAEHCGWCAKWEQDIGGSYHLTDEARAAPLRRVDISKARTITALARGITFTPTFVLLEAKREVGRITGYPGADFFYPILNDLLARLEKKPVSGK